MSWADSDTLKARLELAQLQSEINRRRWSKDPALWIEERLGEFVWSKQREVCDAIVKHRRVAVHTAHSQGKSWLAARIGAWWIDSHPPGEARFVSTAPSDRQVKAILWHEINRAHAKGGLPGRTNQKEWWMRMDAGNKEMVAFGAKPADMDMAAFQGIHAPYVLVITDESSGIPDPLWHAADSLVVNDQSRFLAIGNPDDPSSYFADICKPGSGWHVIHISAYDSPNFTDEDVPAHIKQQLIGPTWVQEKLLSWGRDNALFISKVLGEFPEVSTSGLIPLSWVAKARDLECPPGTPRELGVDVGAGGDRTIAALRQGPHVRIIHRSQNPDTMETAGEIANLIREHNADLCKIDEIGIGRGVVDRLKEQGLPVVGINVGRPSLDKEHYANLRAEGWWSLRDRFQTDEVDLDPQDDTLAAQLVDIKFRRNSRGQIQIESKDSMRARGKSSPDEADAIMLAFISPLAEDGPPVYTRATWGTRGRRFT